jgi:hypothetical protein
MWAMPTATCSRWGYKVTLRTFFKLHLPRPDVHHHLALGVREVEAPARQRAEVVFQ